MLFVSSKVSQLALLPQGRVEAARCAKAMVMAMEEASFGNCTNTRACEAVCPKNETIANIARLNREFIKAKLADEGNYTLFYIKSAASFPCGAFLLSMLLCHSNHPLPKSPITSLLNPSITFLSGFSIFTLTKGMACR